MAVDLGAIRQALADQLSVVAGVRAYPWPAARPVSSAGDIAVEVLPDVGEYVGYHESFAGTAGALTGIQLRLVPLVPLAVWDAGWRRLDQLLSAGTGITESLVDAVETDRTLGGVVDHTIVLGARDVRVERLDGDTQAMFAAADVPIVIRRRRN